MSKFFLFTATVTAVYPKTVTQTVGNRQTVSRNAYTIDVLPIILGRPPYSNIPVMRPNSGGVGGGTGFIWLPNVGDLVVCAFIEGFDLLPVCLGSINNASSQQITSEGNTANDCIFHHVSGSFIRMRGVSSPEIEINHAKGTVIKIDSSGNVTITSNGDVTIEDNNINVTCQGDATIETGGNATIKAGGKILLSSSDVELGASAVEKIIKGDSFMSYFNTHIHPTGVGPSGPPTSPMQNSLLSSVSKTE